MLHREPFSAPLFADPHLSLNNINGSGTNGMRKLAWRLDGRIHQSPDGRCAPIATT